MTSSIYPLAFVAATPTITSGSDILSTPVTIISDHVTPGGGGILRLQFSFVGTDMEITVFNNSVSKGKLNGDNSFVILSDGYYRFDIEVESGDIINLQSNQNITTINFIRAHLVQFGA